MKIDNALRQGHRRLTGGSSLLLLLVQKRGLRHPWKPPPLTEEQILRWADRHRQRTGSWPKYQSGAIADAPGETRAAIDSALRYGRRELPGGSSLARLLEKSGRRKKRVLTGPDTWYVGFRVRIFPLFPVSLFGFSKRGRFLCLE